MHIFISYAKNDTRALARELRAGLAAVPNVTAWMDEGIDGGDEWARRIQREIDRCDWMIVLISPDVNRTTSPPSFVLNEIQYARSEGKPVIPVLAQPTKMLIELMVYQHIDVSNVEVDAASQIVEAVCKRMGIEAEHSSQAHAFSSGEAGQVSRVEDILPPPFEWCAIPAGFVMLDDASGYGGTKGGQYWVESFQMAKYPVTNAQFGTFVRDPGGYVNSGWWRYSSEAQAWRAKIPGPKRAAARGDDLPCTNVSWYDAIAFCWWLSAKTAVQVALPTEHQWQRAAQGDSRRKYPWGNEEPGEWRCNWNKNVDQITPVTRYSNGASPYGVMDMSGNVWEWCSTVWGADDGDLQANALRCARGGAWNETNIYNLHAAARYRDDPEIRLNNLGFRIVMLTSGD